MGNQKKKEADGVCPKPPCNNNNQLPAGTTSLSCSQTRLRASHPATTTLNVGQRARGLDESSNMLLILKGKRAVTPKDKASDR